jgi:hypothetical protein
VNRGHITLFSGLVVCAVADAFLTLTLADPEEAPAAKESPIAPAVGSD